MGQGDCGGKIENVLDTDQFHSFIFMVDGHFLVIGFLFVAEDPFQSFLVLALESLELVEAALLGLAFVVEEAIGVVTHLRVAQVMDQIFQVVLHERNLV